jgi:RNA polymerase-binding transcription factor DksA
MGEVIGSAREALRRARADVETQIVALTHDFNDVIEAARFSNADDEHDPEGATIAFERAQAAALLAGARQRLAELDAASTRCDTGTYGTCEVCGEPIPPQRLAVRPSARTCVPCSRRR